MQGALYTRDFLERGICEEPAWAAITGEEMAATRAELEKLFAAFPVNHKPNEGVTEGDLIYPVLDALGDQAVVNVTNLLGPAISPSDFIFA